MRRRGGGSRGPSTRWRSRRDWGLVGERGGLSRPSLFRGLLLSRVFSFCILACRVSRVACRVSRVACRVSPSLSFFCSVPVLALRPLAALGGRASYGLLINALPTFSFTTRVSPPAT